MAKLRVVGMGPFLEEGVRRFGGGALTRAIVRRSKRGTVRIIEARHNFERKVGFAAVDGR